MRTVVQRIKGHPRYAKVFHWGKLITLTGGGLIVVQVVSLISGILIIRLLPTHEYALYTLVNTMLGTMTILADGGITSGVMAEGGKVWQDKEKLGIVIVSGLHLRKKFAIVSLTIATPALFYLLYHHGASWVTSLLIVLSLIPAFYASLSDTLLEVTPKLRQQIVPLQKNQVEASLGRLLLIGLTVFLFPWTFIAVLAGGVPRIWANIRLRKISATYADLSQNSDLQVEKKIRTFVKRILPGAIYYSISGQITIWLISIFGSTIGIAQVGALGRLTIILSVITSFFSTLVVPRFARLPEEKSVLLSRFLQIQILLFIISGIIIGIVMLFPSQILWVLGKAYNDLNTEVVLITVASCIGMIGGITFSISVSRSWILPSAINITGNVLTQLILIFTLDLSITKNILLFSIVNSAVAFCMLFIYFIFRNYSSKEK